MAFFDWLKDKYDSTVAAGKENWGQFKENLANTDWGNVATKGVSTATGLTGIISNGMNSAKIQDTPWFDAQLSDLNDIGNRDYSNYSQIISGFQNMNAAPRQDYDTVRGMTEGQRYASFGSGLLSGISTGASIGGLKGALVGGFIGGIGSLIGLQEGDVAADIKTRNDNLESGIAQNNAYRTLQSETEETRDYQFRNRYANRRAYGGQVERKQMDINEFASRVLNKPKSRVVRTKCKGGVMIKINR